jgi:hypothetical protein
LQAEWESVDFFTRLPDTAAYQRARDAAACEQARLMPKPNVPFGEFMAWGLRFPVFVWEGLNELWWEKQYRQHGSYGDQAAVSLYYRDRELELRRAVQAQTWPDMRRLRGVMHPPPFKSRFKGSRILAAIDNKFLLGGAAIAEAQRRIIIAALALERYRARHGAYPHALSGLAPEFLKKPPVDFMDGDPLRYRLSEDGHFILYSVGLGGEDNGGRLPPRARGRSWLWRGSSPTFDNGFEALSKSAIVWPLPASVAAVEAVRVDESKMNQQRPRAAVVMP